eukprot:11186174-Lingulodinium_polyedra.AAC.1
MLSKFPEERQLVPALAKERLKQLGELKDKEESAKKTGPFAGLRRRSTPGGPRQKPLPKLYSLTQDLADGQ